MSDGALSRDEIDALLAGVENSPENYNYTVNVKFEYDTRELEKIKNILIGLNDVLPEIITNEYLDEVVKKWVKKYLKVHLGRIRKNGAET